MEVKESRRIGERRLQEYYRNTCRLHGGRLTTKIVLALLAGHPKGRGSSVKQNQESLRRCSNSDWTIVLHLMGNTELEIINYNSFAISIVTRQQRKCMHQLLLVCMVVFSSLTLQWAQLLYIHIMLGAVSQWHYLACILNTILFRVSVSFHYCHLTKEQSSQLKTLQAKTNYTAKNEWLF